ncbi:MAG TPA: PEP/pyruvate-binding domain-containing protein [Candidatus Xenobia bacterium]
MEGPQYELTRSFQIFNYLAHFNDEAQDFIRRLMRFVLKRDRVFSELQYKALVQQKAEEFMRRASDPYRQKSEFFIPEAKKQLTDLYFAANYSLDYLKYIVAQNAPDIETFKAPIPEPLDFNVDLEKADVEHLIKRMYAYEALSVEERQKANPDIQELRIVLIQRLISSQPEFIRVAHRYLSIGDIHNIHDQMVGSGRVGGKSAGMLLAHRIVVTPDPSDPFDFSKYFRAPQSFYVGDDAFHNFLDYNHLLPVRNQKFKSMEDIEAEYPTIEAQIVAGNFPVSVRENLRKKIDALGKQPIIVRSSSLLEDNFGLSFAGKYDSYFLANQGTPAQNLDALAMAIKRIYAGVFSPNAMAYRRRNEIIYRYESMAILVQEVEGNRHGRYFLPDLAGVIFSENPYCWSRRIRKEDGLLRLVHGLGTRAVDRVGEDYPRMVALGHPTLRPEAVSTRNSQRLVDVVDLQKGDVVTVPLQELIDEAGMPSNAVYLLSTLKDDDRIQEAFTTVDLMSGKPVITFDRLLGRTNFPRVLKAGLEKIRRGYGMELDLEMAADINGKGECIITLLQCRPQSLRAIQQAPPIPDVLPQDVVFRCEREIPSARIDNIRYLVYVDPDAYSHIASHYDRYEVARIVGRLNHRLEKETAIILGPGRWGSNNILLGVPVKYYEINNFKLLGEVARASNGVVPEVSYGTHFFQDLVETGIVCIPIYPDRPGACFNDELLLSAPNALASLVPEASEFEHVIRVVEATNGRRLHVRLNGKEERGLCYLAAPEEDQGGKDQGSAG